MEKKEQPKTESSLHHYKSTEQTEVTFSVLMMKRLLTTIQTAYGIDKYVKVTELIPHYVRLITRMDNFV